MVVTSGSLNLTLFLSLLLLGRFKVAPMHPTTGTDDVVGPVSWWCGHLLSSPVRATGRLAGRIAYKNGVLDECVHSKTSSGIKNESSSYV